MKKTVVFVHGAWLTSLNSGFTNQGEIKPDYASRIQRVLARADELGMVVILGMK